MDISKTLNLTDYNILEFRFDELRLLNNCNYSLNEKWMVENPHLKDELNIVFQADYKNMTTYLVDDKKVIAKVFIHKEKSSVTTDIYGSSLSDCRAFLSYLKTLLKPIIIDKDNEITLSFWYNTQQGPNEITRTIVVPSWEEIQVNYPESTFNQLSLVMQDGFTPAHGGQLLLWRGQPGTGKTFALRALCHQWKDWCSFDYVVDADQFFGGESSYLMSIINESDMEYDDEGEPITNSDKWKLIILEDAGELLSIDAKDRVGQALSRLLNLVDGLIGQGLKILVLITTNEDIEKLHPAVSRPGRTASIVSFELLSNKESKVWANSHGFGLDGEYPYQQYSLAELFSRWAEFDNKGVELTKSSGIGFRMMADG